MLAPEKCFKIFLPRAASANPQVPPQERIKSGTGTLPLRIATAQPQSARATRKAPYPPAVRHLVGLLYLLETFSLLSPPPQALIASRAPEMYDARAKSSALDNPKRGRSSSEGKSR
jgi:hypothetical protein